MAKIIVYSTPTCPYCVTLKDYLKEKELEFDDINVAEDSAKADEMIQKSGQMGVPVVDIDGEIIIGFDREKINKSLNITD